MTTKTPNMTSQVYNALYAAAERMGCNNYRRQLAEHVKAGRSPKTFRMTVTPEHRRVIDAMGSWTMSDHEAMSILHEHDVMAQRLD